MNNITPEEREALRKIGAMGGKKGGLSKSEAKREASKRNGFKPGHQINKKLSTPTEDTETKAV